MNKLHGLWLAMLTLLFGCNHPVEEHMTSDGLVISGPTEEQPEYAKAMFDENFVLAEEIASELVDESPDDAHCLIMLAHPQMLLGKLDDATANYEKAIELDPSNTTALYSRGLLAQEQEDFETAKHYYERTLRIDKDSPDGHYGMAAACEGLGLHAMVIDHASKFLQLQPDSPLAAEAQDMIDVATEEMAKKR